MNWIRTEKEDNRKAALAALEKAKELENKKTLCKTLKSK
jgi:hypothetical protein